MREAEEARAAAAVRGLMAALDTRNFDAARRHLASTVELDAGALWGAGPALAEADDVVSAWRSVISGLDAVRHDLGPLRVAVGGDRAEVACPVDIRHFLKGRIWRVTGTYHVSLSRRPDWRVRAIRLDLTEQQGDPGLIDAARQNSPARPC